MQDRSTDQANSTGESSTLTKIGRVLKDAREKNSYTIHDLAESLRIGEEQLIALESGEHDLLPEDVFIKAMVRRVSERLGIDATPLIDELQKIDASTYQMPSVETKAIKSTGSAKEINILKPTLSLIAFLTLLIFTSYKQIYSRFFNLNKEDPRALISLKRIEITSLSPSKAKIINSDGRIIFNGTIREPLIYPSAKGLEIYSAKPELIRLKEGNESIKALSIRKDLKWHKLTE